MKFNITQVKWVHCVICGKIFRKRTTFEVHPACSDLCEECVSIITRKS